MHHIPPPSPRQLLPPLLACLPTAFASPRPPPALLPLLSPILRQRVQYISTADKPSESWLLLLCWEKEAAQRLVDIVTESDAFELHPVSGEMDYGEVDKLGYRRLDEETLQAMVGVSSLDLTVIYLWCQGDVEEGGDGWRVSEVRPMDEDEGASDNAMVWAGTIAEADERAKEKEMAEALRHGEETSLGNGVPTIGNRAGQDDDNADDDYWARYDSTPGRTPALTPGAKQSPFPDQSRARSTSEAEYYAQYAQVQPEMDHDDPDEDRGAIGESTLNGDAIASAVGQFRHAIDGTQTMNSHQAQPNGLMIDADQGAAVENETSQPSASSPLSIQRLQDSAELQSVAEVAIKQHVSTSMKSLFRLCRSTGMDAGDFNEMVRTELDTLSMMAEDD